MWNTINLERLQEYGVDFFEATKELKELIEDIGNV
jgi:hypothetical protein